LLPSTKQRQQEDISKSYPEPQPDYLGYFAGATQHPILEQLRLSNWNEEGVSSESSRSLAKTCQISGIEAMSQDPVQPTQLWPFPDLDLQALRPGILGSCRRSQETKSLAPAVVQLPRAEENHYERPLKAIKT
jgi:hypothetical protein